MASIAETNAVSKTPEAFSSELCFAEKNVVFFHLCRYPNPRDQMHQIRKFVINSKNELVDDKILRLTPENVIKFLKKYKKDIEYRVMPAFDFSDLNQLPSVDDVLKLRSCTLNEECLGSNYAPF